ncbi:MAG: HAMP domain-containing protein [Verrucomicrobia bacterium]|nr:HAMP domain-containing protein [Verrucomicrobiota bacterium]
MMSRVRDLPLQRRLFLAIFGTCGVALVCACAVLFWFQAVNFRRSFASELKTLGSVVALHSVAPLTFDDRKSAAEVLAALRANRAIAYACLLDARGEHFARLGPADLDDHAWHELPDEHVAFADGFATLVLPVALADGPPGHLLLRARFADQYRQILVLDGLVVAGVLLGALGLTLLLTVATQDLITRPIAALAAVAEDVIAKNDYTVRAPSAGRDEVGRLTATFNLMLDQIQARDQRLREEEIRLGRSLREKETLLREIHHRVKNNLQVISGLLHFQGKKLHDPAAIQVFGEARHRLKSMILVHEKLYRSRDLAEVDFADYVRALVADLASARDARGRTIPFAVSTVPLRLPIETALPAGMILAELVTNVIKYAFPGERVGTGAVRLATAGDRVHLAVEDDGAGFPAGFDPRATGSFGWKLIANLVMQLDGEFALGTGPRACVTISFPQPALPAPA